MRKPTIVNVLVAIFFIAVAGCATMESAGHKYVMKGQILDVSNGEANLCIGSAEGAKAGQEFTVYRNVRLPFTNPSKEEHPSYKREQIGTVKIEQVFNEHYAKAKIVSGDIKANDVAELCP